MATVLHGPCQPWQPPKRLVVTRFGRGTLNLSLVSFSLPCPTSPVGEAIFSGILEVVWPYSRKNAMENGSKNQKEAHFLEKPLVYLVGVIFVVCFRDE